MSGRDTALSAALAAGGAVCAAGLAGFPAGGGRVLLWAALAAAACFFGLRFLKEKERKWPLGALGFLLVLAVGLGMRLDAMDETGWDGLALCLGWGLLWTPAAGGAALMLSRGLEKLRAGAADPKKTFLIAFAVIFLCWLPVEMAFFPGLFGYDVYEQVGQFIDNSWLTHHPLAHTLLVCGFWAGGGALGSYTMGVFAYALTQMLALSAAMAYALAYLAKLRCPKAVLIALTALFALGPQHSLMAISVTKDIPFAVMMILACVESHRLLREPDRIRSWKKTRPLVLSLIGACLFRNNAPMAIAAFAVFAVILVGRGRRARMAALLCAVLVSQSVIGAGMSAALNAGKGAVNEMLSVPAQQLSRIVEKHGYDEPVSYEVTEWVPNAEYYQASRADFTKMHLKVKQEGELAGFVKFWVRELFHFPIEYIDAFLLNCRGYWDPADRSFASVYGDWPDTTVGALITDRYEIRVTYTSFLPGLLEKLDDLYYKNQYQSVPGLSTLICPATYTWLLLFAMAWAVRRQKWEAFGTGALMLMYLLTLFLGPCALVRYSYYLMAAAPILTACLLSPGSKA